MFSRDVILKKELSFTGKNEPKGFFFFLMNQCSSRENYILWFTIYTRLTAYPGWLWISVDKVHVTSVVSESISSSDMFIYKEWPYKWIICVCSYNNISSILLPTLQCCENVLLVLESCSANYRVTDCFPLLNILRFFARQSLTLIFYRHIFSVVTLCTFVYVIIDTQIVLFSILYMSSFAFIYHFCTFVP